MSSKPNWHNYASCQMGVVSTHHLRLALKMAQAACDRMEHWLMCCNIFHVKQTMADTKM